MKVKFKYYLGLITFLLISCVANSKPSPSVISSATLLTYEEPVCKSDFADINYVPTSCAIDNTSPMGTYRFISSCSIPDSEKIDFGVYVENLKTKQMYQITSDCFLNYRPVVQNKWISDDLIGFIIWSNPHYGFYFEINVVSQEMGTNHPVSDDPNAPPIPIP